MTREDTVKIMAVIKVAYPGYYKDASKVDIAAAVNLWFSMLSDEPYGVVETAIKRLIAVNKWPPTISEVLEQIAAVKSGGACYLDEMEAWALVSRAIRNCGYKSHDEFQKLPELVRRSIGSHTQLHEWALMDISTVQSVVQSNFLRTYRAKCEKQREYLQIPGSVKRLSDSVILKLE